MILHQNNSIFGKTMICSTKKSKNFEFSAGTVRRLFRSGLLFYVFCATGFLFPVAITGAIFISCERIPAGL